tara:strand:- start:6712 stop:6837 length:126 start_codon:yes stop_codon:yes gene_type:complete
MKTKTQSQVIKDFIIETLAVVAFGVVMGASLTLAAFGGLTL